MRNIILISLAILGFSSTTVAATDAVAISAFYETGAVGFGQGRNKNKAGKAAKADCKQANSGRSCKYFYWTLASSHMVVVQCNFPIGTRVGGENAVQGGHSQTSLGAAKAAAYKKLTKTLSYGGLRATDKNCKVIASYSNGKFSK